MGTAEVADITRDVRHSEALLKAGIGPVICRKIVERHGGTIAATSPAGKGATFTVTLPVTQATSGHVL